MTGTKDNLPKEENVNHLLKILNVIQRKKEKKKRLTYISKDFCNTFQIMIYNH